MKRTTTQSGMTEPLPKWRVGIISTDYDLQNIRKSLIRTLHGLGFATVAFEESDFPVQPGLHSHEVCVRAVSTMDIVVLVLNRRSGGLYVGNQRNSVTEQEFWTAFNQEAMLIPCVAKRLYDERLRVKTRVKELLRRDNLTEDEARARIRLRHADSWQLLDFLDRIQHAQRDQFMVFYETPAQLIRRVHDRLAAMSPHLCRQAIARQVRWLDSQRSTSGLFESVGYISTSGLYQDPPARIISGPARKRRLRSVFAGLQTGAGSILLTGAPGAGKTVELARAFKKSATEALRTKGFRLPFYVSLKGVGLWYHFDFHRYINEVFAEFLKREPYPCFDDTSLQPVFYIDGLDEGQATPKLEKMESIAGSPLLSWPCIIVVPRIQTRQ